MATVLEDMMRGGACVPPPPPPRGVDETKAPWAGSRRRLRAECVPHVPPATAAH